MKKRVISGLLALVLVLSLCPMEAFAMIPPAVTGNSAEQKTETPSFSISETEESEWESLNARDVEIEVTDGYHAITDAEVTFSGQTKKTNSDGKALFTSVSTREEPYDVSVVSSQFGTKDASVRVRRECEKGADSKLDFLVSFWKPDDPIPEDVIKNSKKGKAAQLGQRAAESTYYLERHNSYAINGKIYISPNPRIYSYRFIDYYDIISDTWSRTPDTLNDFCTMAGYNKKLYCFGHRAIMVYDTETETWAKTGADIDLYTMQSYLDEKAGKIYLYPTVWNCSYVNGYNNNRIYIYDIASNTLHEGKELSLRGFSFTDRMIGIAASYNGKFCLYAMKNARVSSPPPEHYLLIFNSDVSSYEQIDIPHDGIEPTMTLYDGKLYFYGGENNTDSIADIRSKSLDIYDIESNVWRCGRNSDYGNYDHSAVLIDDEIYMSYSTSIYIYDIRRDSWRTEFNAYSFPETTHSSVTYNGKIYSTGMTHIATYTYASEDPEIIQVSPVDPIEVEVGTDADALKAALQEQYPVVSVTALDKKTYTNIPVVWDVAGSEYSGNVSADTTYVIRGNLDLTQVTGLQNSENNRAKIEVTVALKSIVGVSEELEKISVPSGTTAEEVQARLEENHPEVEAAIKNHSPEKLPVVWKVAESGYNAAIPGIYTIYGDFNVDGLPYKNPNGIRPPIDVEVVGPPDKDIKSAVPQTISVPRNIYLEPVEKTNLFGLPHTIAPPKTVTVECEEDGPFSIPVRWHVEEFRPEVLGKQTIYGDILTEGTEYTNNTHIQAKLEITVTPAEYLAWAADTREISVSTYQNTTLEELSEQMAVDGSGEISVNCMDMDSDFERVTFCNVVFKEEDNPDWGENAAQTGEYTLTASLPDNFTPLSEDEPGTIPVRVTVKEPLTIVSTALAEMNAYQSVAPKNMENVPTQVQATLSDDSTIPLDVEWAWQSYNKDVTGDQFLVGRLVNLPRKAKQPEGEELTGTMKVSVQAMEYEIQSVPSGNQYTVKSGLTLAEITAMTHPCITYKISSITRETSFVTEYEAPVVLDDEVNMETFNSKETGEYEINATVNLPSNIHTDSYTDYDKITLKTEAVQILRLETPQIMVREGTPFADIQNKPETVTAVLDVIGPDGKNKREELTVNWGTGNGYNPNPADLTDDNCVEMSVEGQIAAKPQYISESELKPSLFIAVCREFDIVELTPARFPAVGVMNVNLGSSLDDIYNQLEQHTVMLTLRSTNGVTSTQEVTFELRAQENSNYDPEATTTSTYTLTGYLPVADNIKNPSDLKVEVVIETKKYVITNTKIGRVTGVVSGTAFKDIPMPATAEAVRDDGTVEAVPVAQWDGSKYNPTKIGTQVISGTFALPRHLENPDNRQPKVFVSVVNPTVRILSVKQIRDEANAVTLYGLEESETSGYIEHKYQVELLHANGVKTKEIISMFTEQE